MTKRFRGGVVAAAEVPTNAFLASGIFNTTDQMQKTQAGTWPKKLTTSVQHTWVSNVTGTPWVHMSTFSSLTGFGTKYANPSTSLVQNSGMVKVEYSPQGTATIYAPSSASGLNYWMPHVWRWSSTGGLGTKYTYPTSSSTTYAASSQQFSITGKSVITVNNGQGAGNGELLAYNWDSLTGFSGARAAGLFQGSSNQQRIRTGPGPGVVNYILKYTTGSSPYYQVLPYTENPVAIGTALSQPYIPSDAQYIFDLATGGTFWANVNGDFVPLDSSGYYLTKRARYTTFPGVGTLRDIKISPNNNYIAIAGGTSPFVAVYTCSTDPASPGWGTRFSNPATIMPTYAQSVRWSPDEGALIVATAGSPYLQAYAWSPAGFGTKFSDPGTTPLGAAYSADSFAVSPN